MMKKLLSVVLALAMVYAMVPAGVIEAAASQSGDYIYTVTSATTATITNYIGSASLVPVPSYLGGYKITAIGEKAFYGHSSITNVSIPSTITNIGKSAFQSCTILVGITMPSTLLYVGAYAFSGTPWFSNYSQDFVIVGDYILIGYKGTAASISIPTYVKSIQGGAFSGYNSLTSIEVPGSVTYIGSYAFYNCSANLTLPAGISNFGPYAFSGYKGLVNIIISAPGANIGDYAFSDSSAVISVTGSLSSVGNYAFSGCTGLKNVIINSNGSAIGDNAFAGCYNLSSVTLSGNITGIGNNAFKDCLNLTVISIPGSVQNIGGYAFACCPRLTEINVDSSNNYFCSVNGVLFNKAKTSLIQYPGCKPGDYEIPSSVNSMAIGAFSGSVNITGVTIPSTVSDISPYTFSGCTGLTEISIPNKIISIENNAFEGCTGLTEIAIPSSVKSIGQSAFSGCSKLGQAVIPIGITEISDNTFADCSGLTNVSIPISVATIGNGAFINCESLTEVTIPNAVTTIGVSAFEGCKNLTSVTIGSLVATIGSSAFKSCTGLKSINIPDSVTNISNEVFSGCSGLKSVVIGKGTAKIGSYAFYGCTGLTQFVVDDGNKAYSSENGVLFNKSKTSLIQYTLGKYGAYVIPNSVTIINDCAFESSEKLTEVTFSSNLNEIGSYAFEGCINLKNFTLPESITKLDVYAFRGCSSLTEVTIPANVSQIQSCVFYSCTGLTQINTDENNLYYTSENGVLFNKAKTTLLQYPLARYGDYAIPNSVTDIGSAFVNSHGITGVTIPASITSTFGAYAFEGCDSLTQIAVDNENTYYSSLDGVMFNKSKTSLVLYPAGRQGEYTVPGSVTEIHVNAFKGSVVTKVTMGSNVTAIGDYTFSGCTNLTELPVGNGVKQINMEAFNGCLGLTEATFPDSVSSIGTDVFLGCLNLESITTGNGMTCIGYSAFRNCTGLKNLTISGSVTQISDQAFSGCTSLNEVTIPSSVRELGWGVFYQCTGLTSAYFMGGAPAMDDNVFAYCAPSFKVYYIDGSFGFFNLWNGCNTSTFSPAITLPIFLASTEAPTNENVTITINYPEDTTFKEYKMGTGAWTNYAAPFNVFKNGTIYARCEDTNGNVSITASYVVSNIAVDGFIYKHTNTEAQITGYIGTGGNITIPVSLEGLPVTSIGTNAFLNCTNLINVRISNSVTNIGDGAFRNCSALSGVAISSNVTTIGSNAFEGCTDLTSVSIPGSVKKIGSFAFNGCTGLATAYFLGNAPAMGTLVFDNCAETFSVKYISGNTGFINPWNSYNTTVFEPLATPALEASTSLITNGNVTVTITYPGDAIVKEYKIGNGSWTAYTTSLLLLKNDTVYARCKDAEGKPSRTGSIVIGNIDKDAPETPDICASIILPTSGNVKISIAYPGDAISKEYKLGTGNWTAYTAPIVLSANTTVYAKCSDAAGNISETSSLVVSNIFVVDFTYTKSDSAVEITGYIGNKTDIEIPSLIEGIPVKSIRANAFYQNTAITSVKIPDSVTSLGESTFSGCVKLRTVTLPNSITDIGASAFYNCSYLSNVILPNSITGISASTFSGCSFTEVTIPDSVTIIGAHAFDDCYNLTKLDIPESVTEIGDYAFYNCGRLPELILPNSLTKLGMCAFASCDYLIKITLPNSITSIGSGAFTDCSGLTDVKLPDNITGISDNLFADCSKLKSIVIPNSATAIGKQAFLNCTGMSDATIGTGVINIGESAFSSCTGLKNVVIPSNVKTIGINAFGSCRSFTGVFIPSSVTSIGNSAFSGCSAMTSAYFFGNAPTMGSYVFSSCATGFTVYYLKGNSTFTNPWCTYTASAFIDVPIPTFTTSASLPTTDNVIVTITYPQEAATKEYKLGTGAWTTYTAPLTVTANTTVYARCKDSSGVSGIPGSYAVKNIYKYTYTITNSAATITACSAIWGDITIPATLGGYPVTTLGNNVFKGFSDLTSVTIPYGVTTLGEGVFWNCTGLTTVNIPDSVTQMGTGTFSCCSSLKSVVIPNGMTSLSEATFNYCSDLTDVLLPDSITRIGNQAFGYCSSLSSVSIPSSVTTIDPYAFYSCTNLKDVYFFGNAPALTLESTVFDLCATGFKVKYISSKTGFTQPWYTYPTAIFNPLSKPVLTPSSTEPTNDAVTVAIDYPADAAIKEFKLFGGDWTSYTAPINLQTNSTVIARCFDSSGTPSQNALINVDNIVPPDPVIRPSTILFTNDSVTVTISYPLGALEKEYKIGNGAWYSYTTPIPVATNTTVYARCKDTFGVTGNTSSLDISNIVSVTFSYTNTETGVNISGYTGKAAVLTLPGTYAGSPITGIADKAFEGCSQLISVKIPNSVTHIGSYAFNWCTGLKTIKIPDSITTMGEGVFNTCKVLDGVTLPSGITNISAALFSSCYGLTAINIPEGVTSIGQSALGDCQKLTTITIPDSVTAIGQYAFDGCLGLKSIRIGNGVTAIGDSAFYGCEKLTGIHFPNSVSSIGNSAFSGCKGLTDFIFPNNLTAISNSILCNCTGLSFVTIPNKITSIGSNAFGYCTNLIGVTLPKSLTTIGNNAFSSCYKLTSINIPNGVTSIGTFAFSECSALNNIILPEGITSIDAFYHCTSLKRITIPNSVKTIGTYAFSGCTSLTNVTIGSGVTTMGSNVFDQCDNLRSVYFLGNAPSIGSLVFPYGSSSICKIYYLSTSSNFHNPWDNKYPAEIFEPLASPTLAASTTDPIAGNVIVTITYPAEAAIKEYKLNNTAWAVYTGPVELSANDTVLARCYDINGKPSYTSSKDVNNILYPFTACPDSTAVIDRSNHIIYGLNKGITQEQFEAEYIQLRNDMHAEYTYISDTFGTGTKVSITDSTTKAVLETYTIVIFGDVNGDGNVDATDADKCVDVQNWKVNWNRETQGYYYKAGDVNGDGNVDVIDADIMTEVTNWRMHIDQTTGLAVMN